jgi:glutathione S-transferase
MDELVFYTNPQSRGRMVRWMLEEMGIPYRAEIVPYGPPMKGPDYRAVNPMGKVPALRRGATTVTECAACITWLALEHPETGLIPDDRGHFLRWMFFGAGPVDAAVTNRALGVEVPPEKRGFVGYGHFDRVVETLEGLAAAAPFLGGERFSALDCYLGAQIGFGMQFGTIPERPALRAYWDRIRDRPAAVRARAIDDALLPPKVS